MSQPGTNAPTGQGGEQLEHLLNLFVFDYLKKKSYHKTATSFCTETQISPDASTPIDTPDSFLGQWWYVFWELFSNIHNPKSASPMAKNLADAYKQQTMNALRQRQAEVQRHIAMSRVPTNPAGGARVVLAGTVANPNLRGPANGPATPTPGGVARVNSLVSPALPNGIAHGDDPQALLNGAQFMPNQTPQTQLRSAMGYNPPNFPSVTQNMADAGLANRDPISLNAQEKSKVLGVLKTGPATPGVSSPGLNAPAGKKEAGKAGKKTGTNTSSPPDAGSLAEQDAKRRRSNTSGRFSPASAGTEAATTNNQAFLNSNTPIMNISNANNNNGSALGGNYNANLQHINQQRAASAGQQPAPQPQLMPQGQPQQPGQRNLSGPMAGNANYMYNPMQTLLSGAGTNNIMANVNSLEAMQNHQRIQQLRPQNPQAYGHMNGNQGVLMLNGQAMMANVPSQGMAMGLSQAAMGGIPMNFTPNGAAVASPYPPGPMSAGVNPPITLQSPTPTTPNSSGGNKKRKATPQLTAKAKNNLVGSPLNAESSIGSGPMSPATKPSPHSHDPMAPQPSLPPTTPNSGALLSNNNIQPGNGTPLVGTPASHSGNNQTSHPPPTTTLATSSGAAAGAGNVSASTSLSGTGVQSLSSTVDLGHDFDSIPPLDMNSLDSLSMPMDDYASAFMDNPIPGFDLENFDMKQFMEHQP